MTAAVSLGFARSCNVNRRLCVGHWPSKLTCKSSCENDIPTFYRQIFKKVPTTKLKSHLNIVPYGSALVSTPPWKSENASYQCPIHKGLPTSMRKHSEFKDTTCGNIKRHHTGDRTPPAAYVFSSFLCMIGLFVGPQRERNVIGFSAAVWGEERCVMTKNGLWQTIQEVL